VTLPEWKYLTDICGTRFPLPHISTPDPREPSKNILQYIYFDINTWEKRVYDQSLVAGLEGGFMSPREVGIVS
jgi:hypothetical protein